MFEGSYYNSEEFAVQYISQKVIMHSSVRMNPGKYC